MRLRRALHARGLRYRVHRRALADLRRDVDVVFVSRKIAIFVDGCYWHGCSRHRSPSGPNKEWWEEKLRRNIERDRETDQRLVAAGWCVIRVWEHADPEEAAEAIERVVRQAREARVVTVG